MPCAWPSMGGGCMVARKGSLAENGFKVCSRDDCEFRCVPQPVSFFGKAPRACDGLRSDCNACHSKDVTRRNRADPLKKKARAARDSLLRRLKLIGRRDDPRASAADLTAALIEFYTRFPVMRKHPKRVHLCHRVAVKLGGGCTMDNLYWGWRGVNFDLGDAPTDVQRQILLYLLDQLSDEVQSRPDYPQIEPAYETQQAG